MRIPAADIISRKSSNGTVFLTVYKNDIMRFDEVNCGALYCLPISDVELIFDTFPLSIDVKVYDGSIESTIRFCRCLPERQLQTASYAHYAQIQT